MSYLGHGWFGITVYFDNINQMITFYVFTFRGFHSNIVFGLYETSNNCIEMKKVFYSSVFTPSELFYYYFFQFKTIFKF
jgi:hypothetical protein